MNKDVEFLIKLRDAHQMAADATNEYIESLAPKEVRDYTSEELFLKLKFEPQQGLKLGQFEVAYHDNPANTSDNWKNAFEELSKAKASIKDRYHGKGYAFSYWTYESRIYRQKLREGSK